MTSRNQKLSQVRREVLRCFQDVTPFEFDYAEQSGQTTHHRAVPVRIIEKRGIRQMQAFEADGRVYEISRVHGCTQK